MVSHCRRQLPDRPWRFDEDDDSGCPRAVPESTVIIRGRRLRLLQPRSTETSSNVVTLAGLPAEFLAEDRYGLHPASTRVSWLASRASAHARQADDVWWRDTRRRRPRRADRRSAGRGRPPRFEGPSAPRSGHRPRVRRCDATTDRRRRVPARGDRVWMPMRERFVQHVISFQRVRGSESGVRAAARRRWPPSRGVVRDSGVRTVWRDSPSRVAVRARSRGHQLCLRSSATASSRRYWLAGWRATRPTSTSKSSLMWSSSSSACSSPRDSARPLAPSWRSLNAFCRVPQSCGCRLRSTTGSGYRRCSFPRESRTTEFDSIEPPQRHHFSSTWRRLRDADEKIVSRNFASWNHRAAWLRAVDSLRCA